MSYADQDSAEAGYPGRGGQQGRLIETGGRAPGNRTRPPDQPLYRIKRSVEVFPASDGSLYLLRLGAGDDLVLPDPEPEDRRLLAALEDGPVGRAGLEAELVDERFSSEDLDQALAQLESADVLEATPGTPLLAPESAERYDRQLIYFADLAEPGQPAEVLQQRLSRASVVLLGCGGLGSWVACGLSCAGVGELILIDDDRIELSNLNRQLLFAEDRIGELKIEAAAAALRAHNADLELTLVERRVRRPADLDDVLDLEPELVIATADWPPHELSRWVNEACVERGVPWIGAGQFPPRLRVGPLVLPGRSACFECLEIAARRDYPLYEELAGWRARGETPDASVGPVSGVIGSLLASEAMHFLLGKAPASIGHALLLDLQTMELEREVIAADPACHRCESAARCHPATPL